MDFTPESINTALNLATGGIDAIGKIADLVGRLKRAVQSPEGAADPNVETIVAQLEQEIRQAKLSNELLEAKVSLAKQHLAALDAVQLKLSGYTIFVTDAGSYVYALKNRGGYVEDLHFLCPNCFHKNVFSILQGGPYTSRCLEKECGASFDIERMPQPRSPASAFVV